MTTKERFERQKYLWVVFIYKILVRWFTACYKSKSYVRYRQFSSYRRLALGELQTKLHRNCVQLREDVSALKMSTADLTDVLETH